MGGKNSGTGVEIRLEASHLSSATSPEDPQAPSLPDREDLLDAGSFSRGSWILGSKPQDGAELHSSLRISGCADPRRDPMPPETGGINTPLRTAPIQPRYTIVKDLPYDRKSTTMFPMCPDCAGMHEIPWTGGTTPSPSPALLRTPVEPPRGPRRQAHSRRMPEAAALIKKGRILGIKGIGGFHLVCDPTTQLAVRALRRAKTGRRSQFHADAADLGIVERYGTSSRTKESA